MTERTSARLIGTGAWLLVLGAVAGLLGGLQAGVAPTLIVTTHVTMIVSGVAFLCFGLMWPDLALDERSQSIAAPALIVAAYGAFVTGMAAGLAGIGERLHVVNGEVAVEPAFFGPLLPPTGDAAPLSGAEPFVSIGVAVVVVSTVVGLALVLRGVFGARRVEGSPEELHGDVLRRVGVVLFTAGVFAIFVTGLTGIEGLPIATHAAIPIFGILFMGLGLAWRKVRLPERFQVLAVRLLMGGAVGTLLAGVLAMIPTLGVPHDTVAVSPAGVLGSSGGLLVVKLVALAGALCMAGAGYIVWNGFRRTDEEALKTATEGEDIEGNDNWALTARWLRVGALLLFLGAVAALMASLTRAPRLAVGTYGTMPIAAPLLMALGLTVPSLRLNTRRKLWAFRFTTWGVWGVLIVGMLVAMFGIGGSTLENSGRGYVGTPSEEALARLLVDLSVLLLAVGIILSWFGLRVRRVGGSAAKRTLRIAAIIAVAISLQAAFWHVTAKATFGDLYPLHLPDLSYGMEASGYESVEWLRDADGTAQNWTEDDWRWFAHATQGGAFEVPIPREWLMALEQPRVPLWPRLPAGRLMDSDYLIDFGFLLSDGRGYYDPEGLSIWPLDTALARHSHLTAPGEYSDGPMRTDNPDGLPVGFAGTDDWLDQASGRRMDVMGFTCAACHTGQVDYVDDGGELRRIRIEGGPANVDLGKFRTAVGISLALTKMLPGRFDRFAATLHADSPRAKARLRTELDELIERGVALRDAQKGIYPTTEGFARLDAIGRIANHVFANDLANDSNLQVANAPVNFPHIWDVPWFEWVQYNASFKQPMMRNAGESMGVFASVDLKGLGGNVPVSTDALLFSSSIDVMNLHEMETLVAGERPFEGLESPRWPDFFPELDMGKVTRGRALYGRLCDSCHGPAPEDGVAFADSSNWATDTTAHRKYLRIRTYDLDHIGTDPLDAINFANRRVILGELGDSLGVGPEVPYGVALPLLIGLTKERRYCDYGIWPPEGSKLRGCPKEVVDSATVAARTARDSVVRDLLDGHRPPLIQGPLEYRARPLNGIWATPPFLHNGAVPNLYQLLSPQDERPDTFWLGSKLFEPDSVGLYYGKTPGGFLFDTSLPGNSNEGHRFEADVTESIDGIPIHWRAPRGGRGIVGPLLTHDQRMDLIEYMKWLPPLPPQP